jgi:NAD(P)-dependent dehydrogenase (short-subunit alcohol dehydrogenase family)
MSNDPSMQYPRPPYPPQQQESPGRTEQMSPRPDHGEETYVGNGQLKDRVALITGSDSGIGRAVAIAFAREGADVLISFLNEERDARETAHWVEKAGRRAVIMGGDIKDERHCRALVDRAIAEFGRLDILVNNAAHMPMIPKLADITAEIWDITFRTNIYAMFYLCKAAVPHMKPGSAIINTSSSQTVDPAPRLLAYAATKGAVETFTTGLASLLAKDGIRVNAVVPGPVWTPLVPSGLPAELVEIFGRETSLGRAAQPAELAATYVLLASNASSFTTGAFYEVTGGRRKA